MLFLSIPLYIRATRMEQSLMELRAFWNTEEGKRYIEANPDYREKARELRRAFWESDEGKQYDPILKELQEEMDCVPEHIKSRMLKEKERERKMKLRDARVATLRKKN